jgi:hypothetical protein
VTYRIYALFFLTLWFLFGAMINVANLHSFNLQQAGVQAIVERGTMYVDGSDVPDLQVGDVDVFEYNEHLYAAKQPGQFLFGALVYYFLQKAGILYATNFILVSALVTFFTASLTTALAATAIFSLSRSMAPSTSWIGPLLIALSFGIGTTAFVYSGIAHHDAIASSLFVMAIYMLIQSTKEQTSWKSLLFGILAGVLLGLTITTSMLPFPMVVVACVYTILTRRWRLIAATAAGIFVGLTPLLIYDAISFGNPFLVPNIAGNYSDTFFQLDFANMFSKLEFYLRFLIQYSPIAIVGFIGLFLLPFKFRREQVLILGMLAAQVGYIFNIATVGDCQYGPRYLLPAMPFFVLGLVGLSYINNQLLRVGAIIFAAAIGLVSVGVSAMGALYGAMFCDLSEYAFLYFYKWFQRKEFFALPLSQWLAIPLLFCVVLQSIQIWQSRPLARASARA